MSSLIELALIFLRLGCTAFGGPAAHLAMMEQEFVVRREWLTKAEFLDRVGVASLIPGPSSTEVAIYIGYSRAGIPGLMLAGLCFILPAGLIVAAIAAAYVSYGALPAFQSALSGIKPVVVGIIAQAIASLATSGLNSWPKRVVFAIGVVFAGLGLGSLPILFGGGIAIAAKSFFQERDWKSIKPMGLLLLGVAAVAAVPIAISLTMARAAAPNPINLFLYFAKLGSVLYGSGYVLLSFLDRDLVGHLHWLSRPELLDASSVGQFTPGPVFTTATFIGYLRSGPMGAVAATVGIFLPSFLFVAMTGKHLVNLRKAAASAAFLDGINAAALSLMVVVGYYFAADAIQNSATAAIAVAAFLSTRFYKVNSALLIALGAFLGLAFSHLVR